jgi:type I site-specific restriction endonuclease
MTSPEERARKNIDQCLTASGWLVQSRDQLNLGAGPGVAVREFPLSTGFADYLLFVDRRAIGAVEAKPEGMPLSGVEAQSAKYGIGATATGATARDYPYRDLAAGLAPIAGEPNAVVAAGGGRRADG